MKAARQSGALELLARVTVFAIEHPWRIIVTAAAVAAVSIWLATGLEIRSSFEELLPSDVPSVAQIKELVRRVGGDGTVLVTIERTDGSSDLAAAEALAPRLAAEYLAMGSATVRNVEYDMGPVESYFEAHWPLFVSQSDLEKARDAIRKEVRKAKREKNPLFSLGGALEADTRTSSTAAASAPGAEAQHAARTEGAGAPAAPTEGAGAPAAPTGAASVQDEATTWLDPGHPLPREEVRARFARYEHGFFVAPDHRSLTLVVRPAGTALGVDEARALLDQMQRIADGHRAELAATHLRIGFGGTFPLFVAEYEAIIHDVASTALLCVSLVLASLFLFYRDLRSTAALGIAVLAAVAATFGLTRLTIGYLNTQTAFLGSIVVGNGINYGLIYLARVAQLRRAGKALLPATVDGAKTAAQATLLAAAASSVSFATLVAAANRGFRHFGFIGGVGMLLCWVFTFALVPALLSIFEKVKPVVPREAPAGRGPAARAGEGDRGEGAPRLPRWIERFFARPALIAGVFAASALVAVALFIHHLPGAVERNLDNLTNELKGKDQLLYDNDRAQSGLGKSIAGAIALLPSREAADGFCDEILARQAASPDVDAVIQGCDTLSSVVPRGQETKLAVIDQIVHSLSDLVLDELPAEKAARLRVVRAELAAQRPVDVADAPPTLLDRFRERDGTIGRLAAVTARPNAKLELARNLQIFVDAVRDVPVDGQRFSASGENVIFADLLKDIDREGPTTTALSLLGVCALVLLFFRNLRMSAEVVGSLVVGVILMGGVAAAIDLKINFFNFIVFPITFGIAVDYGANVSVRIEERDGDVLGALREVGPAVALCSWTSIIGYGSLLFALNRALRSFGWYAMIGEITTIITALVLLPALVLLTRRVSPSPRWVPAGEPCEQGWSNGAPRSERGTERPLATGQLRVDGGAGAGAGAPPPVRPDADAP